MKLSFDCPHCGKPYRNVKPKLIGKKARCSCGNLIRIGNQDLATEEINGETPDSPQTSSSSKSPKPKQPIPKVQVEVKQKPLVDDEYYSDLDRLLAGHGDVGPVADVPVDPRLAAPVVPEGIAVPKVDKPSNAKLTIGLLAVFISATIGIWFGMLVVALRFVSIDQVLLQDFVNTMAAINAGEFGTEEMAPGISTSLVAVGWTMWAVALAMMLLAVGQLVNAFIKLFIRRELLPWADGLMAAAGIVFVFLIVASLFLHSTHMTSLNRELNKFDVGAAVGESSLQNVQRVRDEYDKRSRHFMTVMLVAGTLPLSIFTCSMVRLFVTTGEPTPTTNG